MSDNNSIEFFRSVGHESLVKLYDKYIDESIGLIGIMVYEQMAGRNAGADLYWLWR